METASNARSSRTLPALPTELRWFMIISLVCLALSILSVVLRVLLVHVPQHGLPSAIYTKDWFGDVYAYIGKVDIIHSPTMYTEGVRYYYPAPAIFVYVFLHWFAGPARVFARSCYALVGIALAAIALMCLRMHRSLQERGINAKQSFLFLLTALICSWPVDYALHQGNIEALLWVGVAVALWAYYRGNWWLFAIMIGIFGSAKIYPMLFLALCLRPRKFMPMLLSIAVFAGVTVASLAYLGPNVLEANRRVSEGVHIFGALNLAPAFAWPGAAMFEHSFCGFLHLLLDGHPSILMPILKVYLPTLGVLLMVAFFARVWKMPRANQVLFIALACVSAPTMSLDYTLELLYIPFAWIVLAIAESAMEGRRIPGATATMACFALVLSPELFIYIGGRDLYGQSKSVVLAVMFFLALRYPFADGNDAALTDVQHEQKSAPFAVTPLPGASRP
ncbi:glycosyltransferase family 87 protein [Terriglobus sp. TAA 43]|uniref:glycosyltransferase family 87 protein n=1 Tax=Terriglobus sp. TAA 43 TaxID=278961 RepID=UPI0009FDC3A9|nr:glycosyltransferase family 87 protein [Terriglobus sp. TAA 43]